MSEKGKVNVFDNNVNITIEGTHEHFGGIDLHLNGIKTLIDSLDFKFVEEEDPEAQQKAMLVLLDAIGAYMKLDFHGFDESKRNVEFVKDFLDWVLENNIHRQPEYASLLDQKDEDTLL